MRAYERVTAYAKQLETWIDATGKTQKELCRFTSYFSFGDGQKIKPMDESTFARTIRKPPSRIEGKHNLYSILGVLHLLNVIPQVEEIQAFLQTHDIEDSPPKGTWDDIRRCFGEGVNRYRREVGIALPGATVTRSDTSAEGRSEASERTIWNMTKSRGRRVLFSGLIALVAMIVLLGLSFVVSRNDGDIPVTTTDTQTAHPELVEASFGTIDVGFLGEKCSQSEIAIRATVTTNTVDVIHNENGVDVVGLVAIDAAGLPIEGRLLLMGSVPDTQTTELNVNLGRIHSFSARPLTVRLYDTGNTDEFPPGVGSEAAYDYIVSTGTLVAESIVDPATVLPSCGDVPIGL